LNAALPGDRVLVAAGTYEENITLTSGVELLGAGADVTTIRASTGTVVTASSVSFRTKIDGFTIDGVDKSVSEEYGIYCDNSSPVISNVIITNAGYSGIICGVSSPMIDNVTIISIGGHGIYCYSSSPSISNVTITNTGAWGIYCDYSSPSIGNVTDKNGYFEIPDLPAGTYWVICIKKGYKTGIKKVEVPPGDVIIVDFTLTPSLE